MENTLQISTGEKRIPIVRDGAPAGDLVFNPNDVVFAEKFYRLMGDFQRELTSYQVRARALEKDNTVDADDLPVNMPERLQLEREMCQFAYDQIDNLFGAGTSAMVFGGAFISDAVLQFLEGVAPYIQRARVEKIQKYTGANGNGHKKPRKRK